MLNEKSSVNSHLPESNFGLDNIFHWSFLIRINYDKTKGLQNQIKVSHNKQSRYSNMLNYQMDLHIIYIVQIHQANTKVA